MAKEKHQTKPKAGPVKKTVKEMSGVDIEKCKRSIQILDLIPTPVMAVDKEFNVTYLNNAGAIALGRTPETCVGQKCFSLFNTKDCNTSDCQIAKAFQQDGVFTNDTIAKLPSGELPIRYTATPLKDDQGNIVGGLEFVVDISKEVEIAKGVDGLIQATVDGKLDTRADADKFEGNYKKIVQGINRLIDAFVGPINVTAEYVDRISKGDIPEIITDEYKGDFNEIKNNLNQLIDTLSSFIAEMKNMSDEHNAGDIDVVMPEDKFEGAYHTMAQGVNDMVNGHIAVKKKAMACIAEFGKGNFDAELEQFPGKKAFINENVETLRANVKTFIEEMAHMSDEHNAGDIDVVMPEDKFEGAYHTMAQGVNDMVNGHIAVKKKAMACIAEFGKGNFDAELEQFPGKKAFINETIEAVRKNLKAISQEVAQLIQATKDGKLDTRGHADKFGGGWGELVNDLNQLIDAFVEPIKETAEMMEGFAKKDLSTMIHTDYKGQFGDLKDNINTATLNLQEALKQAAIAAEQVGSASGQVSSSSQALAEGASEQAASLEETASSLEEMASMVNQNAANANQANTLMQEANQVVGRAKDSMTEVNTAMDDISNASQETQKIIKTIDEIAFQTNLLALNAAVEAARAGEAGAGFAVVADEVRNLAMRAAEAAKNTADLIEGTVKKVDNGSELVKTTNDAFEEVAAAATKVAELISEISSASDEQSKGIEEVNKAVAEMDKVTQQNAATAEEAASASEELSAQSNELDSMLAAFELGNQRSNGGKNKSLAEPKQAVRDYKQALQPPKKKPVEKAVSPKNVIPMDCDEVSDGDFKDF